MARPVNAPTLDSTPLEFFQPGVSRVELPLTDGGILEVSDVTFGMIDNLTRDQLPPGSFKVARNARTRDDWIGRREGTREIGTKPNSSGIVKIIHLIQEGGDRLLYRISKTSVHTFDGANWNAYTINDGGFGGDALKATVAQLFGKLYLAMGYSEPLWEIDPTGKELNEVNEAPRGKFAFTFAERIVLANIVEAVGGTRPNKVAWSANADALDWDAESAGSEDLIARDLGNEITGGVALETVGVLVRRNSIVHMSRQPFALAPFRFETVVEGIGSDLAYTTVRVPGGIIFADSRTQDVYFYRPGALPQSLTKTHGSPGSHVHGLLFEDLANAQFAEASFDPFEGEYHLGLSWTTDDERIRRRWICNIHGNRPTWSYDDAPVLTTIGVVIPIGDVTTIDELIGTINALSGSIDSLSSRTAPSSQLYGGTATGEVVEFTFDVLGDWDDVAGSEFQFEAQSQNLGSISRRRVMKDLELNCSIPNNGEVIVEESNDSLTWVNTKTQNRTGSTGFQQVRLPKTQVTGDDLHWRIFARVRGFKIHSWFARIMEKGLRAG